MKRLAKTGCALILAGAVALATAPSLAMAQGAANYERLVESVAERLQEGLLPCPAIEESPLLVTGLERAVGALLGHREEPRRDGVRIRKRACHFYVHAHRPSARKSVDRKVPGVREVELQTVFRERRGERGLAPLAV